MKVVHYHIKTQTGQKKTGVMHVTAMEDFWHFAHAEQWQVLRAVLQSQKDHGGRDPLLTANPMPAGVRNLLSFCTGLFPSQGSAAHQDWPQTFKLLSQLIHARLTEHAVLELMVSWTVPPLQGIFQNVLHHVQEGGRLSAAFAMHKKDLPFYMVPLLIAGEETHRLGYIFEMSSKIALENAQFKKQLGDQIRYPLFLFGILAIIVFLYFQFFLPQFQEMQGMLVQKSVDAEIGFDLVIMLSFLCGLGLCLVRIWYDLRKEFQWVVLLSYLAILFKGGVSLVMALDIVSTDKMSGDKHGHVLKKVARWAQYLKAGSAIDQGFADSGFNDLLTEKLLRGATVTNKLSEAMDLSRTLHQEKLLTRVTRLIGWVQPMMLLAVAVLLCYIILNFYLPLYDQLIVNIQA